MTANLIQGDHVSCSRVGGAMRRESARLRQHAQWLNDRLADLGQWEGADVLTARTRIATLLRALLAVADDLDQAGAAVQRYSTDLGEAHELGRRAELRVQEAGLLLDGTRVIEPWGPASAQEAGRRRAQLPDVQARVDLVTAHLGRARGRLRRDMTRLGESFSEHSEAASSAGVTPAPPR